MKNSHKFFENRDCEYARRIEIRRFFLIQSDDVYD